MADQNNDPILLVQKDNIRSTNFISRDLYERNKESYVKAGYVEADQETVIAYFKKRGIELTLATEDEEETKKTKKTKNIDLAESSEG